MATIYEKLTAVFGVEGADKFKKEFGEAEKTVAQTSKGMTGAMKSIGTAAVAYLSIQVVRSAAQAVLGLTKMADSMRVVQASNERLAKSIGQNSKEILDSVRRGVGGAVDDLTIFKQVNQAILLGIPVTSASMGNMARVATRLGRAVGRDAASALGDLVTGIGRMSPLILDNLGITIKAEEAYRGLGEGATDAEKRLAFFNAVMTKAGDLSKTLGEQLPPIGERLDTLVAKLTNVGLKIGDALSVPVGKMIDRIDALLVRMGTASDQAAAMAAGKDSNPFAGLPGLELLFPAYDLAAGAIPGIQQMLSPYQTKRLRDQQTNDAMGSAPIPKFRFGDNNGKINSSISEREAGAGPGGAVIDLEQWDKMLNFNDHMEPEIRDMTKNFEASFKKIEARAKEDLGEIPLNMEREFAASFANINLGFQSMGIGAGNIFSGVSNLGAGISGLSAGRNSPAWVTDKLLPGLEVFGQASQAFAGAVGIWKTLSLLNNKPDLNTFDDAQLAQRQADLETARDLGSSRARAGGGNVMEINRVKAEIEKRQAGQAAGASTGSNAYSVATSITETQANSIVAVLETQRAQDAERNNILGQSLSVQTDMKFLMSINSGNLTTFAG